MLISLIPKNKSVWETWEQIIMKKNSLWKNEIKFKINMIEKH